MNKRRFLRDNPQIKKFNIHNAVYKVYYAKTSNRYRWTLKKNNLHVKLSNTEVQAIANNLESAESIWNRKRKKER